MRNVASMAAGSVTEGWTYFGFLIFLAVSDTMLSSVLIIKIITSGKQ